MTTSTRPVAKQKRLSKGLWGSALNPKPYPAFCRDLEISDFPNTLEPYDKYKYPYLDCDSVVNDRIFCWHRSRLCKGEQIGYRAKKETRPQQRHHPVEFHGSSRSLHRNHYCRL